VSNKPSLSSGIPGEIKRTVLTAKRGGPRVPELVVLLSIMTILLVNISPFLQTIQDVT